MAPSLFSLVRNLESEIVKSTVYILSPGDAYSPMQECFAENVFLHVNLEKMNLGVTFESGFSYSIPDIPRNGYADGIVILVPSRSMTTFTI